MYDTFMISLYSRNGGGAFLIPFFFFLITSGGPLYYLEVCLGQFTGRGAGHAFEFCPLLKGLHSVQFWLVRLYMFTTALFPSPFCQFYDE